MNLYHSSIEIVEKPELRKSTRNLDFGEGFYMTSSFSQAERWAKTKAKRNKCMNYYVNSYNFDDRAMKKIKTKVFKNANEKWLEFVLDNRKGILQSKDYDLIIGPVADDNVYESIKLFDQGLLTKREVIKRLKTEELKDQYVFSFIVFFIFSFVH